MDSRSDVQSRMRDQLHAAVEDEKTRRRWARRGRRRLLVAAEGAVTLGTGAALLAQLTRPFPGGWFVFLALALLVAVLGTQINIAARWVAGYQGLDERQRAEQSRARIVSHRLTTVLLFALMVAAMLLTATDIEVPIAALAPALFVFFLLHSAFPSVYLAWTQPDEVPDEEDAPLG
ncbi:MAG: hypothetical protein M0026_07530 [Nocardiopsaceae bacterium]|nr:hypothetical protein [Nocardiopsaceae bacterium]